MGLLLSKMEGEREGEIHGHAVENEVRLLGWQRTDGGIVAGKICLC